MVTAVTPRSRWLPLTLTALVAIAAAACGSGATATDSEGLAGTWVGENVVLTVTDTGAQLEMPCASGDIAGALAHNPFSVVGRFAREIGPAVDDHPALYTGKVVGGTMTLDIRLTDTNQSVGPFTLIRGTPVRFAQCV